MKTINTTKGRQQYREIYIFFLKKKAHADHAQARNKKTEGVLEAHRGGDMGKGLVVDGG